MTVLIQALGWLKENWKLAWGVATALLLALVFWLWRGNAELQGKLDQCQAASAAQEKKLEAAAGVITDLQAKAKARCTGSVDLKVGPPVGWNSLMQPPSAWPCPEISFKANMDGSSEGSTAAVVTGTAAASAMEKPAPGQSAPKCETWALALGGGLSLPSATIYHGSAAIDYHRLRAYGTLDTQNVWTAGAQVKVLTGSWP